MSWIYGIIHPNRQQITFPDEIKDRALKIIHKKNISICVGGTEKNIFSNHDTGCSDNCWLAVGFAFLKTNNGFKILNNAIWERFLNSAYQPSNLEGHYIILKWNQSNFEIITDRLGLRDIYFSQVGNTIIFSTRIDWLAKSVITKINFKEFGSRWLLFNQISTNSVLENIIRVIAGTAMKINLHSLEYKIEKGNSSFTYTNSKQNKSSYIFSEKLNEIISLPTANNFRTALSLSGGMDSRVILSYMLKNSNKENWETHTFGDNGHPDFITANRIVNDLRITHQNLNRSLPSVQDCIHELTDYANETIVNGSASAILQLNNYKLLQDLNNIIIIDGGFGELWRREFFYRLLLKGRRSLIKKNFNFVLPHLTFHRADIFNDEIKNIMLAGCYEQIENIFNELPLIEDIGIENWLDLFAIKTRLPNYYGHEQSRIDSIVKSYMPFTQLSLLQSLISIPIRIRKDARLFRKIISDNNDRLSKYQLVKGNTSHPYFLNTFQTRLWSLVSNRFNGSNYQINQPVLFLSHIKEFVNDLVNSKSVKECSFYDYNKIRKIYNDYNSGNLKATSELDWFLSFDIFRRSIYSN